jgi:hypothetical protein
MKTLITAAILFSATVALALPQSQQPAANTQAAPAPAAKKSPMAKTKAEFEAYKAASTLTDAAKLEAAAVDFAQKYPASELRPFLFQQAMGLYQNANNPAKTLEMARQVLKYDPDNAVALLTAAQTLAERTHENDLDKDDRYAEATADARSALQHTGDISAPPNLTPEQFAEAMAQLRGTAHEVIGTIAFKRQDYFNAIAEYNAAVAEEKQHVDPVVFLRLAVAHDKSGDYPAASEAIEKAIKASQPGSQVRQLAEQEKVRLDKIGAETIK